MYRLILKRKLKPDEKNKIIKNFDVSPFTTNNIIKELYKIKNINEYIYETNLVKGTKFHFITNLKKIDKVLEYYFYVIKLKQKINPGTFFEDCYIYILPTSVKKEFKKVITPNEINSGATNVYPDICGGPVYVWRKEEIYKVLVHETLHSVLYDASIFKNPYKKFPKMKSLNLNEVYNEFGTLYTMALKEDKVLPLLKKQLKLDKKNVCQMMRLNHLDKLGDFLNPNLYQQKASFFSYIVLKCLLLDTLLEKCNKKCLENFWKLGFYGGMNSQFEVLLEKIFKKYENENFNDFCNKTNKQLKFSVFQKDEI